MIGNGNCCQQQRSELREGCVVLPLAHTLSSHEPTHYPPTSPHTVLHEPSVFVTAIILGLIMKRKNAQYDAAPSAWRRVRPTAVF